MSPFDDYVRYETRRQFFSRGANAVGWAALASLMGTDGANNSAQAADAAKALPDYLGTEIRQRVQQAPVKFKMVLQVAEPGDKLDDPSIAWPDARRLVELGTLSIARPAMSADAEKTLLFRPTQ